MIYGFFAEMLETVTRNGVEVEKVLKKRKFGVARRAKDIKSSH